ncbi:MAG: VWA domain-containing protein [Candidatus Gastranaerophilales bacterium]|nr:VWA domain-containing protein [Candidatus Gastranaerophilales bacterium]
MNNKRLITLGIIILCISIAAKLVLSGLKNIKVDDFNPAAVMFVVDSSASNQKKLPLQKKFLKQICSQLDPEDQIKIIKVSQEAYMIYEGSPQSSSAITKSMEAFTKYEPEAMGTAYGDGIKKAFSYALAMQKDGYTPAIVVIGDLENEGDTSKQINWDTFPQNVLSAKKYAPDVVMMFLFAHPQKLDMVKEKLNPVLGEQKLILAPEQNVDKSLRKFINALGR